MGPQGVLPYTQEEGMSLKGTKTCQNRQTFLDFLQVRPIHFYTAVNSALYPPPHTHTPHASMYDLGTGAIFSKSWIFSSEGPHVMRAPCLAFLLLEACLPPYPTTGGSATLPASTRHNSYMGNTCVLSTMDNMRTDTKLQMRHATKEATYEDCHLKKR